MSANIPYLNQRLRIRRRVLNRAQEIEQSWDQNLRDLFWDGVREVITEGGEISRLFRVRFR